MKNDIKLKQIRKIMILLLLILMSIFILCACGDEDEDDGKSEDNKGNLLDSIRETVDDKYTSDDFDEEKIDISDIPIGNEIGYRCAGFDVNIVTGDGFSKEVIDPTKTGKVTIINFWGTWCSPCINELPSFDSIAKEYKDYVDVIAIHTNMSSEVEVDFIDKNYPKSEIIFAVDTTNEGYATLLGGGQYYPYTIILDKDGIIVHKINEAIEYDDLKEYVEEALSGKTVEVETESKNTTVPDVFGMTEDEAVATLEKANLNVTIARAECDEVEEGCVFKQSIEAGKVVSKKTKIVITISEGPEVFEIPDVIGKTYEEAMEILAGEYGLEVEPKHETNDEYDSEIVFKTNPEYPIKLKRGDRITVYISLGADELAEVPDVIGKTKKDATAELNEVGFEVVVEEAYSDTVEAGRVISMDQMAGDELLKGNTVTIVVSLGEETTE